MASRTVRARLDSSSEQALSVLTGEGRNESEAVRTALVEAAQRRKRRAAIAAEVLKLSADPIDTAARNEALADMEALAPEWPE